MKKQLNTWKWWVALILCCLSVILGLCESQRILSNLSRDIVGIERDLFKNGFNLALLVGIGIGIQGCGFLFSLYMLKHDRRKSHEANSG